MPQMHFPSSACQHMVAPVIRLIWPHFDIVKRKGRRIVSTAVILDMVCRFVFSPVSLYTLLFTCSYRSVENQPLNVRWKLIVHWQKLWIKFLQKLKPTLTRTASALLLPVAIVAHRHSKLWKIISLHQVIWVCQWDRWVVMWKDRSVIWWSDRLLSLTRDWRWHQLVIPTVWHYIPRQHQIVSKKTSLTILI